MSPENAPNESIHAFLGASLHGSEHGRVRRLKGFLKGGHFEPDSHSPAAEAFVRKVGSPDIEARAEALFRHLRLAFGYKRKELVHSCDAGTAAIKTPDYEVSLAVEQDAEEARSYQINTTVGGFTRPEVVTEDPFIEVFRLHCNTVLIEFPNMIDVEAKIDALEESSGLVEWLDYPADASWLSIKVPGAAVRMELRPHAVSFSIPPGGDLRQLIEGTAKLLDEFSQAGAGLALDTTR